MPTAASPALRVQPNQRYKIAMQIGINENDIDEVFVSGNLIRQNYYYLSS